MTNPQEFRLVLVCSYLTLAMIGIGYNKLIAYADRWEKAKGFTSFSVVIGVAFTLVILWIFFEIMYLPNVPFGSVIVIVFGGFACSGAPMIIGHRARYARDVQEEEDARKGHRPLKWPHDMKSLRDATAEEAASGMFILKSMGPLPAEFDAKLARVKNSFFRIAALMSRAGAKIRLEDL